MKKKKWTIELDQILNLSSKRQKESLDAVINEENPSKILRLIKRFEKLEAKLKKSGDEDLDEIRHKIKNLKLALSKAVKKRRQKLLDEHWEKLKKEQEKFLKEMDKQMAAFRKRLKTEEISLKNKE